MLMLGGAAHVAQTSIEADGLRDFLDTVLSCRIDQGQATASILIRLLCFESKHGPFHPDSAARITGTTDDCWPAIWEKLGRYFRRDALGRFYNVDVELMRAGRSDRRSTSCG